MKEKFVKSTLILLIGGFLTKILGMFIRIITTRIIGTTGIGLYMLILPTFNLFMTIATLSFPVAVSKIVSENKNNNKRLISSLIPVSIILNIVLIIIIILISPTLAKCLLKDENLYLPIIAIGLTLPFISISSIARGYFFGKEKMFPQVISNLFEQIIRLLCIILVIPSLLGKNIYYAISALILVNIISEVASILILFFFLPKNFKITKKDLKYDPILVKDVMNISIPTTLGRLAGSIGYFFEPIIITFVLLYVGYTKNYIVIEYGVINGYVMPILLMPSFLTGAISTAMLPAISKTYSKNNITKTKKIINKASFLSFVLGICATIIMIVFPDVLLNLLYKTNEGAIYLKILAPFFLIFYLQAPFAASLQAINKSKEVMTDNLIGIIIKLIIIVLFSLLKIGFYGFIIAQIFNVVFVTVLHYIHLKKVLK